ncbi:hypothetical protein DFH09DRAFT_1318458 [Mycena vulgaris]|nr:hypothetical protein DFH09DRAFT_1318458 [Mycena vulgaris]
MDTGGDSGERTVSPKIIFGIVFALVVFIALNLVLCQNVIGGPPHRPPLSRPRSSSQTMASDGDDVHLKDGQDLEQVHPTLPAPASPAKGRSRSPCTERAAVN